MVELLTIPDCSSGTKLPENSSAMNCFWTLSGVLNALSTRPLVMGSRSGISIEKESSGLARGPWSCMPQLTLRRLPTAVVSDMRVDMEAFVWYVAPIFRLVFLRSPLKAMLPPSLRVKSLDCMYRV